MVETFCLRLALGLIAPLILLPAAVVPPRFFRVQFLIVVALSILAILFDPLEPGRTIGAMFLVGATLLGIGGSIVWHLDGAPWGIAIIWPTMIALSIALLAHRVLTTLVADDFASAAVLGSAMSAMLMGHSYLIAPAMSLTPLMRLLGCLAVSLLVRIGLACVGLWMWSRVASTGTLDQETVLWLGARWLLGFLIPIVLLWMAWETARIRSTQSATGILYVVTIVVFIGELLSLLLVEKMGFIL